MTQMYKTSGAYQQAKQGGRFFFSLIVWAMGLTYGHAQTTSEDIQNFQPQPIDLVCAARAVEIDAFDLPDLSQPASARDRQNWLREIQQAMSPAALGQRLVRYDRLQNHYQATLKQLNQSLADSDSPLLQHLLECRTNPRECHGYFSWDHPFHLQLYCDAYLYHYSLTATKLDRQQKLDQCAQQPFMRRSKRQVEAAQLDFDRQCYTTEQNGGQVFYVNKAGQYTEDIQYIEAQYLSLLEMTRASWQKAVLPEAARYVMTKVVEELSQPAMIQEASEDQESFAQRRNLRKDKIAEINTYYKSQDLMASFQACCQADQYQGIYQVSADALAQEAERMQLEGLDQIGAATFQVSDPVSIYLLSQAEGNYWKAYAQSRSIMDMPADRKQAYFKYLAQHPYTYQQTGNLYQAALERIQTYGREGVLTTLPQVFQPRPYDFSPAQPTQAWLAYQQRMDYQTSGMQSPGQYILQAQDSSYVYNVQYDIEQALSDQNLIKEYLFNPSMQQAYNQQLGQQSQDQFDYFFDARKEKRYGEIFEGFLPYQFVRIGESQLIRALQKMTNPWIDHWQLRASRRVFIQWGMDTLCKDFEKTFCHKANGFIRSAISELYDRVWSNPAQYGVYQKPSAYGVQQTHAYRHESLVALQDAMKQINQFCFDRYPQPMATEQDLQALQETYGESFIAVMEKFYNVPGIAQLLTEETFFEEIQFSPSSAMLQCFGQGAVFYGPVQVESFSGFSQAHAAAINVGQVFPAKVQTVDHQPEKIQPTIDLRAADLQAIETRIDEKISDELELLQEALTYDRYDQFLSFLEESAAYRVFALMDYAKDHPSADLGHYICSLIRSANHDEQRRQKVQRAWMYAAMIAAGAMAVVVLPAVLGSYSVVLGMTKAFAIELAAGTMFAGISLGFGAYELSVIQYKKRQTSTAVIAGNLSIDNAGDLFAQLSNQKKSIYGVIATDLALVGFFMFKPFQAFQKWFRTTENSLIKMKKLDRQVDFEGVINEISHRDPGVTYSKRIRNILFDPNLVDEQAFQEFLKAMKKGKDVTFINENLSRQIGLITPMDRLGPSFISTKALKQTLATAVRKIDQQLAKVAGPTKAWAREPVGLIEGAWGRWANKIGPSAEVLKTYFYGMIKILKFSKSTLPNEHRLVKMIQKIEEAQARGTTSAIYSQKQIDKIIRKLTHFKRAENGQIVRTNYALIEANLNQFVARTWLASGQGIQQKTIKRYLKPLFHGELLALEDVQWLVKNYSGKISTIEDCKELLKVIKFWKSEAAAQPVRQAYTSRVFQERENYIKAHFMDFIELARLTRARDNLATVKAFEQIMHTHNLDVAQLTALVRPYDHSFALASKIHRVPAHQNIVHAFDLAAAQKNVYKRQFLHQEQKINAQYLKNLKEQIKQISPTNTKEIGKAVYQAMVKTKVYKSSYVDCQMPNSIVKQSSNRAYVRYSSAITLSTNAFGYAINHLDEEINNRWWSKFAFEAAFPYAKERLRATLFVKGRSSTAHTIFKDWLGGTSIMAGEAIAYGAMNQGYWKNAEYLEDQLANVVYRSNDVQQALHEYFEQYPEIKTYIDTQIDLLAQTIMEVEAGQEKGSMYESDIETLFLKRGLIDRLFKEDGLTQEDFIHDPEYQMLMEEGYLDPKIFIMPQTEEEMHDRILEAITEIQYQQMFDQRSGQLHVPLVGEYDLDIAQDYAIQTGSQPLDRFLFYAGYDFVKAPMEIAKNKLVYNFLCNQRFGKPNLLYALMAHSMWKITSDPVKYYLREQLTGM